MTIDPARAKAMSFDPLTVRVERGRLRSFAHATGQCDPVYLDVDAARSAGHPDLPVPPTFFFSLGLESPDPFGYLDRLGVDLRLVLHGEQTFTYHRLAYAGDRLILRDQVTDAYTKRGGTLEFLIRQTDVSRDDQPIARARSVLVVRHPQARR